MKITKKLLKEMVRKIVREQLQEQGTWSQPADMGGLGGFVSKVGTAGIQAAQKKAKSAKQAKQDFAGDKTIPGGTTGAAQRKAKQKQRLQGQEARQRRKLQGQVQMALDTIAGDASKLEAVIKYINSLGAN